MSRCLKAIGAVAVLALCTDFATATSKKNPVDFMDLHQLEIVFHTAASTKRASSSEQPCLSPARRPLVADAVEKLPFLDSIAELPTSAMQQSRQQSEVHRPHQINVFVTAAGHAVQRRRLTPTLLANPSNPLRTVTADNRSAVHLCFMSRLRLAQRAILK